MSTTSLSRTLRNLVGALVLLTPATAYALDNNNGTPQNDCERAATSDYQANLESCRKNLAGDAASITQCEVDASYDYLDALAGCETAARNPGRHPVGNFDSVFEGTTITPKASPAGKNGLLVFGRG